MKKIGKGFYYNVYDLGNGRVRKIPRSQLAQMWQLFIWTFFTPKILIAEFKRAPFLEHKRKEQYELAQRVAAVDPPLFGNPIFHGWEYEQDKVEDLETLLPKISTDDFLSFCQKYVDHIHGLWRKGVGDEVFNFMRNSGATTSGQLILIDTNEYTFEKKVMIEMIKRKRYLRAFHTYKIPWETRSRVKALFDREFSVQKLEELWQR